MDLYVITCAHDFVTNHFKVDSKMTDQITEIILIIVQQVYCEIIIILNVTLAHHANPQTKLLFWIIAASCLNEKLVVFFWQNYIQ